MIEAADLGYEDRLIERIALKEALARRLSARQRRVMCRRLEGYTYGEVALQLGVCAPRARQIELKALERLRSLQLSTTNRAAVIPMPLAAPAIVTRPGFDRAAFLEHMRGLIRLREEGRTFLQQQRFDLALSHLREMVRSQDKEDADRAERTAELAKRAAMQAANAARWAAEQRAEDERRAAAIQAIIDTRNTEVAAAVRLQAHIDVVHAAHRTQAPLDYQAQLQIGLARREWSGVRGAFATEQYRKVRIIQTVGIYGWRLDGGSEYWLPLSVIEQLAQTVMEWQP